MELWSLIGNANSTSYLLGYSDADIVVGKYNSKNKPIPCDSFNLQGPISHIYNPTFFDVDRDDLPELLIRYNITVADGFIQYLDIYKSNNNRNFCSRKLMKQFSARNGFADYSGRIFITGVQTRSEGESWLGASLHEITEIFFDGKNEKLIIRETKPNVLRGTDASYWE